MSNIKIIELLKEMKENCLNASIYNDPTRNDKAEALNFAIFAVQHIDNSNNQLKTAKWINAPYTNERICSNCEHKEPYKFADNDAKIYNFCSNCGAKMEN